MWNEYFKSMMMLMVMAGLLRSSHELSHPKSELDVPMNLIEKDSRQKEWADKAIKRYAETQEKKWRNWNEAMFEPVNPATN
jgi:hypothetical protein